MDSEASSLETLNELLSEVGDQVRRERQLFPGNRHHLSTLVMELGELAEALMKSDQPAVVREEAVRVACIALRIAAEGDTSFP